ncbi:MAG: chain length determinant protein EpsF [Pseudomonadota bacterium]
MDARDFLLILWARRYVISGVLAAAVLAAVGITLFLPDKYDATATVVVTFRNPQAQTLAVELSPSYMATQLDVAQSQGVALRVVDKLKLAESAQARELWQDNTDGKGSIRHWLADQLSANLTVKPSPDSRVVSLTFRGSEPRFAAAVANAFAEAYVDTNLELAVGPARRDASWLDAQLEPLRQRLEAAQARLSAFQREQGIFANDERLDLETERLNGLSAQLIQAQTQVHDAQSRQAELERLAKHGGNVESLREFAADSYVQSIKVDLVRREAELVQLTQQFGANHPQRQRAEAEVASLRAKLATGLRRMATSVASEADIARSRLQALEQDVAAQRSKVLQLKEARDQMPALEREVLSAQAAYDGAASRYNESQLRSREPDANVTVLTAAVEPSHRSSPKPLLNLIIGVFLGAFLGAGAALLLELLQPRARSPRMIEGWLKLPVLGVLEGTS